MVNESQWVAVVFNGEIYNYRELREQLQERGHTFAGRSDTEVILRGYEEWGGKVVSKLLGMFAIGLWDSEAKKLLLARDRYGKKPLFYCNQEGELSFASELEALLAEGGAKPDISQEGFERRTLKDFAHFLDLAKGSCGEVRSMSYASADIGVLSQETGLQLRAQSEALSQRIAAFSRHLRR